MKENKTCPACNGAGKAIVAMDMLARPPKEQAEYETYVKGLQIVCSECHGSGVVK